MALKKNTKQFLAQLRKNKLSSLIFIISLLTCLNLNGQTALINKWKSIKITRKQKITFLNDYIIDFAHFSGKTDSLCNNRKRSNAKSVFVNSESIDNTNYFISLYTSNTNDSLSNEYLIVFLIKNLILSSWDMQQQVFENYLSAKYLEERNQFRVILNKKEIDRLTQIIPYFFNKRNKAYYKKQIDLIYGLNIDLKEFTNPYKCNCK